MVLFVLLLERVDFLVFWKMAEKHCSERLKVLKRANNTGGSEHLMVKCFVFLSVIYVPFATSFFEVRWIELSGHHVRVVLKFGQTRATLTPPTFAKTYLHITEVQ